jgi:hypothetical protein
MSTVRMIQYVTDNVYIRLINCGEESHANLLSLPGAAKLANSLALCLVGREKKRMPLRNHGSFKITVIHQHHHFYGLGPCCSVPSS